MNISMTFEVEAKCYEFDNIKDLSNIENYRSANIETVNLELSLSEAACFLFKFTPVKFKTKDFLVHLIYTDNILTGIRLIDRQYSKHVFVIINFKEVIQSIYESFIRIRCLEKMNALLELDFEDAKKDDSDNIIDEFDIESNQEKNT